MYALVPVLVLTHATYEKARGSPIFNLFQSTNFPVRSWRSNAMVNVYKEYSYNHSILWVSTPVICQICQLEFRADTECDDEKSYIIYSLFIIKCIILNQQHGTFYFFLFFFIFFLLLYFLTLSLLVILFLAVILKSFQTPMVNLFKKFFLKTSPRLYNFFCFVLHF